MRVSGGSGNVPGQFFMFPARGAFAWIDFVIPVDNQYHEYLINLSANPQWKGRMNAVRIDPGIAAGLTVSLDEAEFLTADALPSPTPTASATLTRTPTATRTLTLTATPTVSATPTPTPTGPLGIDNWRVY
jgi:hypothetical protein